MDLREAGDTIFDLARAGLVIGKKMVSRSFADERSIDPSLVGQLVGRLHPQRVAARIADIAEETPSTKTLRLVPASGEPFPPFRAGQFVTVFLDIGSVSTSRAYSISSPPSRTGHLDITVRKMPEGFVSVYLCDRAAVGETVEVSGPAGSFYHEPLVDTDDLVFVAGGSGVTPFMSMIRHAAETKQDVRMHLIYGSRLVDDVIFTDELSDLACGERFLKVDLVISEPPEGYDGLCGFLDSKTISSIVGDVAGKTFYLCGPGAMYELCLGALASLGVSSRRIKRELSGPPPDITVVDGWPKKLEGDGEFVVKIEGGRRKLTVKCGEPLLNALERNRVTIDNLCRSGECGVCRTRLVSGEVFMPPMVTVRKADLAFGYIHPCLSYPLGDVTLRL